MLGGMWRLALQHSAEFLRLCLTREAMWHFLDTLLTPYAGRQAEIHPQG